jgi:hypothetical protein
MGREPWSDLSVQISRRRWRYVPDPLLCLSHDGAAFVRGLTMTSHAEVWLGPEFLNILDSWRLYDLKPDLLTQSSGGRHAADDVRDALRLWLRVREESGQFSGRLCWVRDALRESCLPAGMEESLVPRWEAMAQSLDERLSTATEASGPVVAAMRDSAALAAVLPGAVLLSSRDPAKSEPPAFCRHMEAWRVPCRRLEFDDDLVALERGLLLHLQVEGGLAGFLWGGLRLAVVHLVVPGHLRLLPGDGFAGAGDEPDFLAEGEPRLVKGAWEDARAFWYDLTAEDAYAAR